MNTIINKNTKSFKEFEKNIFDIICLIGESLTSHRSGCHFDGRLFFFFF